MDRNITTLLNEIAWLEQVIKQVITTYLMQEGHEKKWTDIAPPALSTSSPHRYESFITSRRLNTFDRLALALCLAIHLKPSTLDLFLAKNKIHDRQFTEFGGVLNHKHSGFIPTVQTYMFLTTATSPELRAQATEVLNKSNILIKEQILVLNPIESFLPFTNSVLYMNNSWAHYFISGKKIEIPDSPSFLASKINTSLEWSDVVLNEEVMMQINEIKTWLKHGDTLMDDWGLSRILKPGYRSLFIGPPGTGKRLSASLLGKTSNKDVFKVNFSSLVSKYIGETEKHISRLFDTAQRKGWVLFFDEADAVFGKRTEVKSSNDRHSNQQIAYLLQRIEDFTGLVIIACSSKANIGEAFTRRFQSIIHFPIPSSKERHKLWQNAFTEKFKLDDDVDLEKISDQFELSGGAINNVLRTCALAAIERNESVVTNNMLMNAIRKEFRLRGKTTL